MADAEKIRENRLRRMAARQGLALQKSRRRDTHAIDYGKYWLSNPRSSNVVLVGGEWGADLDEIEDYLKRER